MQRLALLEMPQSATPTRTPAAYQQYRTQQVLGASPMQLVLMVYEVAIVACEARDVQKAGRAVGELIGSLNFDYGEIPSNLFRLYEYCLWELRRGNFINAAKVLRGLKRAWEEALAQGGAPGGAERPAA
jgi:flagellar secretion chaperone FliS